MSFWLLTAGLVFYLIFFNDAPVPLSRLGESLALVSVILLPTWLWVSNRSQGVPIFPLYALSFFPTYAVPICRGDSRFVRYTEQEITTGALTIIGYLLMATLIWWQCTNRNLSPSPTVRALNPAKSTGLMFVLLVGGILFELFGALAGETMGGVYQALRGYAQNGSRLAIFVLLYQMGRGQLPKGMAVATLSLCTALIIRQVSSTILASSFPVIGLGFVGFFLGSGKVPLKTFFFVTGMVILLHSGKAEMRAKYMKEGFLYSPEGKELQIIEYPAFFAEWIEKGIFGLTRGTSTEGVEIENAKERSALLPLLLQIQTMSGRDVPFLDGVSYEKIPSMLVPRIITKDKAVSHISNMIMAIHYDVIDLQNIWSTSIGFDPVIEAYANYGYWGVAALALGMGIFLGLTSLMTTGVPLFSFRFLMSILVVSAVVSSNNTMGVFITTIWQGFLALFSLSLVIMKTIPNPLAIRSQPLAREGGGNLEEARISSDPKLLRHARPKRFIYGEEEAKRKTES